MAGYGQFCPIAKATELIGEKWTLLVLRELLLGTTRFNDFQRAISRMSPTLHANLHDDPRWEPFLEKMGLPH